MTYTIPQSLAASVSAEPDRRAWLVKLPKFIRALQERWCLTLHEPFDGENVSCSWVAPVTRHDGTSAIFKIGMPHMEGTDEILGLRFWNGDGAVRVLESDIATNSILLERCEPGTLLRAENEERQDVVIASLLRRLWKKPSRPHAFRSLNELTEYWARSTATQTEQWTDSGLVNEGLQVFKELSTPSDDDVVLATDLHAGNVLASTREPWLVIDPKPFLGDCAYDATQHLLNCRGRLGQDPIGLVERFSELLQVDSERVRLWTFARLVAEPGNAHNLELASLARGLERF